MAECDTCNEPTVTDGIGPCIICVRTRRAVAVMTNLGIGNVRVQYLTQERDVELIRLPKHTLRRVSRGQYIGDEHGRFITWAARGLLVRRCNHPKEFPPWPDDVHSHMPDTPAAVEQLRVTLDQGSPFDG